MRASLKSGRTEECPFSTHAQAHEGIGEEERLPVSPLARAGQMAGKGEHCLSFEDIDMVRLFPTLDQEELPSLDGIPARTDGGYTH